jgi:hypothetical protein
VHLDFSLAKGDNHLKETIMMYFSIGNRYTTHTNVCIAYIFEIKMPFW